MMKKIAIFVNTLENGGAEKQSISLLNVLNKKYNVYFIIFHGDRIEYKLVNLIKQENFMLIKLQGSFLRKLFKLHQILHSLEITYLFSFLTLPNVIGSIVGKIAKVDYIFGSIRNSALPKWKFILEKLVANTISTKTIFNNYSGEILYKKKGLINSVVIPNCFELVNAPSYKDDHRIKNIITVGRFVQQKDYKTALKSIAELKKLSNMFLFHIIGYGNLENRIRNWISKFKLESHVIIHINPNNIPELLNQADIYLSTSLYEGTSNSIMEAMNAYLPIVATNVGDNNRLIIEKKNGYLHDKGNYKAIAKSLELLINNYELRIIFGNKSNHILKNNYSYDKFRESYLNLINP